MSNDGQPGSCPVDPMRHYGLAVMVARQYSCPRMSREDMLQEALVALCEAAQTYNPERAMFSTWAVRIIRHRLFRVVNSYRRIGQVGNKNQYFPKALRLHLRGGGSTDLDVVRPLLANRWWGPSPSDWDCFLAITMLSNVEQSLDAVVGGKRKDSPGAKSPMVETVEDEGLFERMDEGLRIQEYQRVIEQALEELPARQREITVRRLLVDLEDGPTLQELGDEMGVSRERVRQLESKARIVLEKWLGEEVRG